ncbi:uncharacterized protein LOC120431591 [Culex pipiens pallens]|uniref:uncharacterized protein LOC120431591 n=1 Tax=Culex pipiens pallens TaxID=42434 RepID=UPI00195413D0|nr:uncharacterized protein LOC120431591 [Culex pipiens pallens]
MVTSYTDKYFLIPKKTSVLEENFEDGEEVCPTNDNIDYDPFSPEPAVEEQAAPRVKRRRIQNSAGHVVDQNLTLNAVFFKRRFVGESSGSQVANQFITGDTVKDIVLKLWDVAKPFVHREVVIKEEDGVQKAAWAENEPRFEDNSKFLVLQDSSQKRRVKVDKLDSRTLINWRDREIRVHIHVYSSSVSCKSLWEVVEKQLISPQLPDRAGAPSNQSLTALAEELREKHGHSFNAHTSAWKLWANHIQALPAHEKERQMESLPPNDLLKFFRSVPLREEVRMANIRRGLGVANVVNEGYAVDLELLEEEVDQMIAMGQRVKARIAAMRAKYAINSSLVSTMAEAMRPEESELSQSLSSQVTDLLDHEHAPR